MIPPAFALYARLSRMGRLAAGLGLTVGELAELPVPIVRDLEAVQETIEGYRDYLIEQARQAGSTR